MPRVDAICTSSNKGERKGSRESALFRRNHGIEGDAHSGPWHRQVSLLGAEDIDTVKAKGLPDIKAGAFAENIVVSGLDLEAFGLGTRIRLGRDVILSLTQIGKVCHSRCQIYHLTGDCIMPRLGLFARVEAGGEVAVGDSAEVIQVIPRDRTQAVVLNAAGEGETPKMPVGVTRLTEKLNAHVYAVESTPNAEAATSRLKHYCAGHSIDLVIVAEGADWADDEWIAQLDDSAPEAGAPYKYNPSWAVVGTRGATLIATAAGPAPDDEHLSDFAKTVAREVETLRSHARNELSATAAGSP
jgi:MOSC domain-containing protein YiiM